MVKIKAVESKADWESFIELPWKIYKGDSNWVPPLRQAVKDTLDVRKNPFFKHATMHPMLAYRDNELVGRVVAVLDDNHVKYHDEKTGFFGFFECINDQMVANALLDEALQWLKDRGMTRMRGPVNPSTNHEAGLLVEGFQDPPFVMMTYNPPYYPSLFESWGLSKSKDLLAYVVDGNVKFADRIMAQAERLKQGSRVTFRTIDMNKFEQEVDMILDIYNDAWEKNWGFIPMDTEEFRHMAKDMKLILDPNLLLIVEVGGQPAGFALALPDVNQAIKKIEDGKLLPTGIFKLLWNLKGPGRKSTINRCRILTLGIKKAFRDAGLGPLLYVEYLKRGPKLGYQSGEASWILEDNVAMNRALEGMCGKRTKVYRLYDRAW